MKILRNILCLLVLGFFKQLTIFKLRGNDSQNFKVDYLSQVEGNSVLNHIDNTTGMGFWKNNPEKLPEQFAQTRWDSVFKYNAGWWNMNSPYEKYTLTAWK